MDNAALAVAGDPQIVRAMEVVEAQERATIDTQIATAKQYPRIVSQSLERIKELATLDQTTAEECWYALPRAGKTIEGPSARFAEIVASSWGNLRVQSRVVSIDATMVTCQAACHDLESNTAIAVEVKRRITDKNGKRFSEDMITTTANAACSIAMRNAILKVVPKALLKTVTDEIRRVGMGDERTFKARLLACFTHFASQGVSNDRVLAVIDKRATDDVTIEDLATLRGLQTAINEGTTSLEEAFPANGASLKPGRHATRKTKEVKNESPPREAAPAPSNETSSSEGSPEPQLPDYPDNAEEAFELAWKKVQHLEIDLGIKGVWKRVTGTADYDDAKARLWPEKGYKGRTIERLKIWNWLRTLDDGIEAAEKAPAGPGEDDGPDPWD